MKAYQPSGKNNSSTAAGNTSYSSLGLSFIVNNAEATAQTAWYSPGVSSKLTVKINTNDRAASTIKFRNGAAYGNQSISTTTTGVITDLVNSDILPGAGELVDWELITGAGGTTFIVISYASQIEYGTGLVVKFGTMNLVVGTTASTTYFGGIAVRNGLDSTTEGIYQTKSRSSGTWKNLYSNSTTYTWGTNGTLRSRKNTANGNMLITVSATGTQTDLVNTDAIAPADLMSMSSTTGSGAGTWTQNVSSEFLSSDNTLPYVGCTSSGGGFQFNGGTTDWRPFANGRAVDQKSTVAESDFQITPGMNFIVSNIFYGTNVTNTLGSNATQTFRKNGVNGNQTFTITAGVTGYYEDLVNSDVVNVSDVVNLQTTGGTSGSAGVCITGSRISYPFATTFSQTKYPGLRPRVFAPGVAR